MVFIWKKVVCITTEYSFNGIKVFKYKYFYGVPIFIIYKFEKSEF